MAKKGAHWKTHLRAGLACALVLVGLSAAVAAIAAEQGLTIRGLNGVPVTVSAEDFGALPHSKILLVVHGQSGTFSGVPLNLFLARVKAPLGEALRGPAMTVVVLVKACDGYRVVLSLPDVDPGFRNGLVVLADSVDGHALNKEDGPYRLIVEGDKRAARAARCVTSIELRSIR